MITITAFSSEEIRDPFGIIPGKRYEVVLELEVDEEDELYSENGLSARVIYGVGAEQRPNGIVKYELLERTSGNYLAYDLEEDELEALEAFCQEHETEIITGTAEE